jgi:DNA-binding MarR family transcriptional regulator
VSSAAQLGETELAAWRGFLQTYAVVVRELDAELQAAHGLPMSSYDVLVTLESAPEGKLRMRELADRVLLSRSGITRLVDRMEREGLIERRDCPDDARGLLAVLTDSGRQRLEAARPTHLEGVRRRFLAALSQDEAVRLGKLWERFGRDSET